ncbi:MAG: DegV family protein [Coriobacteriales bacterium]|nr:DegV family protein [Coriobacteriales bacterium]
MEKIILSADSTCDLSDELKEKYNVEYFPYHIIYKGEDYKDNVDIKVETIYEGFYKDGELPKTAAASPGVFMEYFKQFTNQGYKVLHFCLGSSLSSACNNAIMAGQSLDGVYVVDSQSLSTGTGLQVIAAGKQLQAGKTIEEVYKNALKIRNCSHASFVLDTLEFLAAGGRCPTIASHIGKALNFKPQITVHNNDASMSVGKLYRGPSDKVIRKYMADQIKKYDDIILDDVFVTSTGFEDDSIIDGYVEYVQGLLPGATIHKSYASCTIGSHCGPHCIGVLFLTKSACA